MNNIITISDLDLLLKMSGTEHFAVSYIAPVKIPVDVEITYIGTYQYLYNTTTKKFEYTYVITDTIENVKTYRINSSEYSSYKVPLSILNGHNIASVTVEKSDKDFEYIPNDNGTHIKIGDEYYKYSSSYDYAVSTYITNAITYRAEYILPTETNGFQASVKYYAYTDKYTYLGNIIKYGDAYMTKKDMQTFIDEDLLADRYNITGVNTLSIYMDNNDKYEIKAINGSKGPQGEQGWKGEIGDAGESAFEYYTHANLNNALPIITAPQETTYLSNGVISAEFAYNTYVDILSKTAIITTDEYYNSYITNNIIREDTNYYTFEDDEVIITNNKYHITDNIIIDDNTNSYDNSSFEDNISDGVNIE